MPRPTRWRGCLDPAAGLSSLSFISALQPDQVGNAVDHAAHFRRVDELDHVVQAAQAEAAHRRHVPGLAARGALHQLDLDLLLVRHGYAWPMISSTFLPRLAAISAGVFIACRPCSVARTTL